MPIYKRIRTEADSNTLSLGRTCHRADFTNDEKPLDMDTPEVAALFKMAFVVPIVSADGFQPGTARAAVLSGNSDTIAFGRPFIANPDLPERLRREKPLPSALT